MLQLNENHGQVNITFTDQMDIIRALTAFQGLNCIYNHGMVLTRTATQKRCLEVLAEVFGEKVSSAKARKVWPTQSLGGFENWCSWWLEVLGYIERPQESR